MSDAVVAYTAIVAAGGAVCTAIAPIMTARFKRSQDQGATELASWSGLNTALNQEVGRLNRQLADQRDDFEGQLHRQQAAHEAEMSAARGEIARLQSEVTALRNIIINAGDDNPRHPPPELGAGT